MKRKRQKGQKGKKGDSFVVFALLLFLLLSTSVVEGLIFRMCLAPGRTRGNFRAGFRVFSVNAGVRA
jgi:hypothetical protein